VATEQAKRNTPIVDEDRPVSRVYRDAQVAELDELSLRTNDPSVLEFGKSRDVRSTRTDEYEDEAPRHRADDYEDGRPRSPIGAVASKAEGREIDRVSSVVRVQPLAP